MQRTHGAAGASSLPWLDLLVCVLLFAGSVTYIAQWPAILGPSDEGLFLYEAKRILEGDVFYRDIYDIITPGTHYVFALLFWIFGTTIVTAKLGMAAIHGFIVVVLYLTGRVLRVPRLLAVVPGVAFVALCQPVWPYVSPHWVSTMLSLLLLLVMLRRRDEARPVSALLPGVILGLMIAVQQQKGVVFVAAVLLLLVVHHVIDRRCGAPATVGSLAATIAVLLAGTALIVLPMFATLLAFAGYTPMYRALVEHPLVTYRGYNRANWGDYNLLTAQLAATTLPPLLKYVPAVLLLPLLRGLRDWWQRRDAEELRAQATLIVFGVFSAASVAYFPDIIHLAFIAPVFFIVVVESLTWLGGGLRLPPVAVSAMALVLVAGSSVQLYRNLTRSWEMYPESLETAFGRIAFARGTQEIDFVRKTDAILQDLPSRTMFIYPFYASLYLMTDAKNPTPYQILVPRYNLPEAIPETIDLLEREQVRFVFIFRPFLGKTDDPFLAYARAHYTAVGAGEMFWTRPAPQ